MTSDITVLRPDEKTADMIGIKAEMAERYVRQVAEAKCARFWVLMERIGREPRLQSMLSASTGSAQLLSDIDGARNAIDKLARAYKGLESGELELAAWRYNNPPPKGVEYYEWFDIGVWPKGVLEKAGKPGAMDWIPIPLLYVLAITTVAAGVYLTSLYLHAKDTAENADYLRAQTEAMIQKGIAQAPASDRQGLANAYEQAQRASTAAASQAGKGNWFATMGGAVADFASAAVDTATSLVGSAESWLPWVLGGWAVVSVLGSLSNIFGSRGRCCD